MGGSHDRLAAVFDFLSGRIAVRKPAMLVVEAGGVGYRVEIPLSTYRKIPEAGSAKVFTTLRISDEGIRIFGFATEAEREVFLKMVETVPQLGPAKAMAILSSLEAEDLRRAVEEGDAESLRRVRGIGPKIADRLVLELKGKLPAAGDGAGEGAGEPSISRDTVQALVSLGYVRAEAEEAVRRARKELRNGVDVEELVRRCLAKL